MAERRSRGTREDAQRRRRRRNRPSLDDRLDAVVDSARNHPVAIFVVALAIVFVAMLYGPARNYYVAMRSGQDLQAYYEALDEQNEALREDLGRLQSEEGIEDEAHRRGYIKDGETPVVTEGAPKEDQSALLGDIELEDKRPWYIKVLDVVFFYSEDSWQ